MSDKNLHAASHQWQYRPDDERYATVPELQAACDAHALGNRTSTALPAELQFVPHADGNLTLRGRTGQDANFTHYSFGQVARKVGAPADYVRTLPAHVGAQALNHGLTTLDQNEKLQLLLNVHDGIAVRAALSMAYDSNVRNGDLVRAVHRNLDGWQVPAARPARPGQKGTRKATEADILPNQKDFGLAVKVGDDIAPAGLYASDHDLFMFLVDQREPVWDGSKFMNRGVFVRNSEVGAGSISLTLFLYDSVCGNHIVWGAENVTNVRVRHVRSKRTLVGHSLERAVQQWRIAVKAWEQAGGIEERIRKAQTHEVAATKEEMLDALFGFAKKRSLNKLTRTALEGAYEIAERTPRYGSPLSVWGMVNGLTEYSQQGALHTDERTALDTQAGRLMEMAF